MLEIERLLKPVLDELHTLVQDLRRDLEAIREALRQGHPVPPPPAPPLPAAIVVTLTPGPITEQNP